jgi:putative two-component system response regulator
MLLEVLIETGVYSDSILLLDIPLLLQSSQLHDVGKIAISDYILKKPGKLTPEEHDEMKKHTTFGVSVIKKIEECTQACAFLEYAKILAETHHEKWNGTGYPAGLTGSDIPILGRLMAIADVYEALTSARTYKVAFTHETSVDIIKESSGSHFDPTLADLFVKFSDKFKLL